MKATVKAPAKINLTLDIVGKRADGYHDVAMVMQTVSLYDTVTVETTDGEGIEVSCPAYPDVPTDDSNIVCKAAKAFFQTTGVQPKPLKITIDKVIPTQAGLAGGSSDGAAVVLALNQLFETHLKMEEMADICARFGSDVPFCLLGGTMFATGTGTTLKKLRSMPSCYIVICKPEVCVSTAAAYAACDAREPKGFLYTDELIKRLYSRDIRGLATCLYNEFEQVMELPEINEIKKLMLSAKALGASMSGSGSAVYAIFLDKKKAEKCANILKGKYNKVFLTQPLKEGCRVESTELSE
ncbi:MAG: 4-(cytidine 5'-diphospho)-2-C-methyl-D-erythritol kinase [Ruminococcus sp.]|uniref:4-(cytidine 5'-diphospho)-2-C-methyl-D-erythritol kinase n=1 Tax=Ruminococcus sp. TaxID=41978 RepID=UPI002872B54F|nr:4-(cytidine 5'-diphospho)-2-C-methyl-D-erythritol kinase [Ruminococcus sp.]MBQ3284367.1 4-(cytidine 5'-diphospho)-2-C-methyl-D-erythritol kinase [Ruminococcus sp.]